MDWVNKALSSKPITKEYAQSVVENDRRITAEVATSLIGMVLELGGWQLDEEADDDTGEGEAETGEGEPVPERDPIMCPDCEGDGVLTNNGENLSPKEVAREIEHDDSGRAAIAFEGVDWMSCPSCGGKGAV